MTWLDVDLRARIEPDRAREVIAKVLGVERVVPIDSPDPCPFRVDVDHRRAGILTTVRFLCLAEFDAQMPDPVTFAVRLAAALQTDAVVDPAFLPGVGTDDQGWLLVRPSGEGVRVFEGPSGDEESFTDRKSVV